MKPGTERPAKPIRITEIAIHQDPFESYKTRLASKLAKRAAADDPLKQVAKVPKEDADVTWFGTKVGSDMPTGSMSIVGGGVGKYLNATKRPRDTDLTASVGLKIEPLDEIKKKRKTGFGGFDNW